MKIITELDKLNVREKTAVAIGKFDGIHVGHRELLSRILEKKNDGLKATVFTFLNQIRVIDHQYLLSLSE